MAKKENNFYYECFAKGLTFANEAAVMLGECFVNYDPAYVSDHLEAMHQIEHTADLVKHDMMERLVKEFLPPIEREDIAELGHVIDDVTDSVEDILRGLYMYNVQELRPEVHEFARIIAQSCEALIVVAKELHNFRKSTLLREKIVEINDLEEQGDRLYIEAVHRLYREEHDPILVLAWTTMFDRMEKCCDCCEEVADVIETVIMKNT